MPSCLLPPPFLLLPIYGSACRNTHHKIAPARSISSMSRANLLVPVKNRSSERRHDLEAEPPSPVNIASILAARVDLHHWFGDVLQPTRIHTHAGSREPQARPSRDGELCRAGASRGARGLLGSSPWQIDDQLPFPQ
jgi:hypothetical protein